MAQFIETNFFILKGMSTPRYEMVRAVYDFEVYPERGVSNQGKYAELQDWSYLSSKKTSCQGKVEKDTLFLIALMLETWISKNT